jgi:hypothetical protein
MLPSLSAAAKTPRSHLVEDGSSSNNSDLCLNMGNFPEKSGILMGKMMMIS